MNWKAPSCISENLSSCGVPSSFIEKHVAEFQNMINSSANCEENRKNRCLIYVMEAWRGYQLTPDFIHPFEKQAHQSADKKMTKDWRPSNTALNYLRRLTVPDDFIEDCIPEFLMYWIELRVSSKAWNTIFNKHVINLWEITEKERFDRLIVMRNKMTSEESGTQIQSRFYVSESMV